MAEATLRKFISVVPDEEGKKSGAFAATTSVNRMGHAITGIGKSFLQVNELIKFQNEWILGVKDKEIERIDDQYKKEKDEEAEAEKKKQKRANLAKDLSSEKLQADGKKLGVKLFKKDKKDKRKWGWAESLLKAMSPIFNAIQWFAQTVITYVVFKWLGDPKNKEKVETFLKFISSLGKFAWWLTENSIGLLMDGVTKTFSWDPNKNAIENTFETLFGALQILGGLAGIWAVSRVLMPWKLLSDVRAMAALGTAVTAAEATGCGPRGRRFKPKGPDGKPKFDPAEVQRRADNIRRIRRNKRLAKLYNRLSALQEAGAKLVRTTASNTKALIETSQAALKSEITRLNKLIDEKGAKTTAKEVIQTGLKKTNETVVKPATEFLQGVVENFKGPNPDDVPKASRWTQMVNWINETAIPKVGNTLVAVKDTTIEGAQAFGRFLMNNIVLPVGKALDDLGQFMGKWKDRGVKAIQNAGAGIYDTAKGLYSGFKYTTEMLSDPKKLMEAVQERIRPKVNKLVEENPLIKNILALKNDPDAIGTVYKQMTNSDIGKSLQTMVREGGYGTKVGREAADKLAVGPIDVIIDLLSAVFDYAYNGESPVNAFMGAAGSFVGYGLGFGLVSMIPGAQGWGSFLGGIAGAMLGEQAGNLLTQTLGKMSEASNLPGKGGLYNLRDPLAKAILGNKDHPQNQAEERSDGNILTPDFKERPFLRHWDAPHFEFGNPTKEGDAKGVPYGSEGGYMPAKRRKKLTLSSMSLMDHVKMAKHQGIPAYLSMMDHIRSEKVLKNISGSEINTTPMMSELSERKVRRVKEIQMHTHVVAVTQPVIKTVHRKATPPTIHYTATNPHVSMFTK